MPEADESKGKSQEHDEALEKMSEKLAKAAASADAGTLKEITQGFYHDAVDLRARNRELNRQIAELRGKIKDGDIVLTGADAKTWAELQKIGIPAGEISKKLTEGTAALQKVSVLERDQIAEKMAEANGYKPAALRQIVRLHNLNLQWQDVPDPSGARDEEGKVKKVKLAVVVPAGQDAEAVPLTDYVDENLGDFRDVLAVSEAERIGNREPPRPQGPRIVRQKSGEQGAGRGVPDQVIEQEVRTRHAGMSI